MPAAAVIRRWQALLGIIGCKGQVGGLLSEGEIFRLNRKTAFQTDGLEVGRGNGIRSVRVKSVDIAKNTSGEGDFLVLDLTLNCES